MREETVLANNLWTSRHVTKKSSHGIKQSINSLEKGIVSDFASQMLPETLNGIELRRVRRQRYQLDLIRVSSEQSKNRFGEMNAIVINDNVLLVQSGRVVVPPWDWTTGKVKARGYTITKKGYSRKVFRSTFVTLRLQEVRRQLNELLYNASLID